MFEQVRVPCEPRSSGTPNGSSSGNVEAVPGPATSCTRRTRGRSPAAAARSRPCSSRDWRASCTFYTAFGGDEHGEWSRRRLEGLGVRVEAAIRDEPTRRAVVFVDANGERTITTLGRRLEPTAADRLPWNELEGVDAVYVTAGDPGALREGRSARVLVATSRIADLLAEVDLYLDAVVGSAVDPAEAFDPDAFAVPPPPGRSNQERPRRPLRDERRSRRLVRGRHHLRGPSSTPTAPGTRSRQDSRSRSVPAWRSRKPWRSQRGAEPGALPEEGRTGTSSRRPTSRRPSTPPYGGVRERRPRRRTSPGRAPGLRLAVLGGSSRAANA